MSVISVPVSSRLYTRTSSISPSTYCSEFPSPLPPIRFVFPFTTVSVDIVSTSDPLM